MRANACRNGYSRWRLPNHALLSERHAGTFIWAHVGGRGAIGWGARRPTPGPAFPTGQIVRYVTSSSHQRWPWAAARGSAWWLLCQPSPFVASEIEPVVAAVLAGFVIAVAPEVCGRVDAPGYVPRVDRAIDDAPEQPLQANLVAAGERAVHASSRRPAPRRGTARRG